MSEVSNESPQVQTTADMDGMRTGKGSDEGDGLRGRRGRGSTNEEGETPSERYSFSALQRGQEPASQFRFLRVGRRPGARGAFHGGCLGATTMESK